LNCPNCGKEIKTEDATFCPYCSKSLHLQSLIKKPSELRKSFPNYAGTLTILGSCIIMAIGVVYLITGLTVPNAFNFLTLSGALCIILFPASFIAGIFSLRKRRFTFSVFGTCLMTSSAIVFSILAQPIFSVMLQRLGFSGLSVGMIGLLSGPVGFIANFGIISGVLSIALAVIAKDQFS
jgi:hypothetical protein